MGVRRGVLAARAHSFVPLHLTFASPPHTVRSCAPCRSTHRGLVARCTVIFAQHGDSSARFLPRYAAQRFKSLANGMGGNFGAQNNRPPFRAMVEQGEDEAMERRPREDRREREVASFMQSRAEQNRELSSLRLAIDRGNDIMQTLVTALLQRMGSSGGRGAGGSLGASAPRSHHKPCLPQRFSSACPLVKLLARLQNLIGDAAEVTYPTLAEDTDLESCVGATAPLPSQVEDLMMVGETSELCCTQVACQESQPMHKRLRKPKARMDL
uniref:Uncharacterized protein n=1 Tax=Sphaerodactylus townsendi TaxID=933632 RepID=A0ACB8FGZ1_9SAUR